MNFQMRIILPVGGGGRGGGAVEAVKADWFARVAIVRLLGGLLVIIIILSR